MVYKKGFTLIDLLIALSISAIVFGFGIPSFEQLINKHKANNISQVIYKGIQQARITALTTNKRVTICGSDDGVTCKRVWNKYFISFVDSNHNQTAEYDEILSKHFIKTDGLFQTRISFGSAYNIFTQTGYSEKMGSVIFCPAQKKPSHIRKVTWNRMGRPYKTGDSDKKGRKYLVGGQTLKKICL